MPFSIDEQFAPVEVKHPSLEGLIAWLETQDPETEYDFLDCDGNCLLDQYRAACCPEKEYVEVSRIKLPKPPKWIFTKYDLGNLACADPNTFGHALSRARALQEQG